MEATADAGEILVSPQMRDALRPVRGHRGQGRRRGSFEVAQGAGGCPVALDRASVEAVVRCIPVGLRDHLQTGEVEPEHRVGVVGFVKYKGVDDLHRRLGPDAVAAALDEVTRVVQRAAEDEGIASSPRTSTPTAASSSSPPGCPPLVEDDEGRMLRALRVVADAGTTLPIKIGVNRGHVFAGEIGATLPLDLHRHGRHGEPRGPPDGRRPGRAIYATPAVLDRSATMFETVELEPFSVKGKSAKVHAYGVGAEGGDRDARPTDELPFVGRDAELAVLQTGAGPARVGWGRRRHRAGGGGGGGQDETGRRGDGGPLDADRHHPRRVLRQRHALPGVPRPGAAVHGGGHRRSGRPAGRAPRPASGTLAPHLEPLLPLVGRVAHVRCAVDAPIRGHRGPIPGRAHRRRHRRALGSHRGTVVVVVVEDTHWLDDASAGLVERIAARAGDKGWLVIASRRSDTSGVELGGAVTIELAPLDEATATGW